MYSVDHGKRDVAGGKRRCVNVYSVDHRKLGVAGAGEGV